LALLAAEQIAQHRERREGDRQRHRKRPFQESQRPKGRQHVRILGADGKSS
jgi:hypothetical protein